MGYELHIPWSDSGLAWCLAQSNPPGNRPWTRAPRAGVSCSLMLSESAIQPMLYTNHRITTYQALPTLLDNQAVPYPGTLHPKLHCLSWAFASCVLCHNRMYCRMGCSLHRCQNSTLAQVPGLGLVQLPAKWCPTQYLVTTWPWSGLYRSPFQGKSGKQFVQLIYFN